MLHKVGPAPTRLLGKLVRGWAVVHHSAGSWAANGDELITVERELDADVTDVIGAGDAFAAAFIHHSLSGESMPSGDSMKVILEQAHGWATASLKSKQGRQQPA